MRGDTAACDPACMFPWLGSSETERAVSLSVSGLHGFQETSSDPCKFLCVAACPEVMEEHKNSSSSSSSNNKKEK